MRQRARRVLCATITILAGCGCTGTPPAPPPPAQIRYDGATTISRLVLPALAPMFEARAGVPLKVDRSGAGVGLRRLFAGEVDVAGVSRSLTAAELSRKPYFQIIGYDALAIYVNEASPVRSLTKAQVKAIFTGAATSWKPLGGKDVRPLPCTERLASERATLAALRTLALDGEPYGKVTEREDPSDCLALVAEQPAAIAAASVAYARPGVRAVTVDGLDPTPINIRGSRYLLTRPLLLVARETPKGPLATLFDVALSPEGQAAVVRGGFVPAR